MIPVNPFSFFEDVRMKARVTNRICAFASILQSFQISHLKFMKWITRERPKIDRIACPWLIKRFIDKEAEIIYVPFSEVKSHAKKLKAIPFDVPDVEFSHYGDQCTFDYFVKKYKITDKAIHTIAVIVR